VGQADHRGRALNIHPIHTGDVQIKSRHAVARRDRRPARVFDVLADRTWTPRLPITCYAIDHPEGLIVVDTGESSHANDPGYQPWWHPVIRTAERRWVAPEEEVGPQLRKLGFDPGSASCVVMTHMHGDHAGGLSYFEGVEVLMTEREAAMALARTGPLNGYLNNHYPDRLDPRRVSFDSDPWESFDASIALMSDGAVRLIPTPGHTLGHLSVVVDRGEDLVLLTGDAAYSEDALRHGLVDGVAQDARLHRETTQRMRDLCARRRVVVVPTHDPDGARRLAAAQPSRLEASE
jgi:N-acyl homoserine lactone hydrolase